MSAVNYENRCATHSVRDLMVFLIKLTKSTNRPRAEPRRTKSVLSTINGIELWDTRVISCSQTR